MVQSLKKSEILRSKIFIDKLFNSDKFIFKHPFKIFYQEESFESEFPVQMLVSVSKKKHKHAVDRNLIKRRIKESYRKNKEIIYEILNNKNKKLILSFLYISTEIMEYSEIEKKIITILKQIKKEYEVN